MFGVNRTNMLMDNSILYYVPSFSFELQSPGLEKDFFVSDKTCMRGLRYERIHRKSNLTPILYKEKDIFFYFEF